MSLRPALLPAAGDKGRVGTVSFPHPHLSHRKQCGTGSALLLSGSEGQLTCCPGWAHGSLSRVLQITKDRNSSPILMTTCHRPFLGRGYGLVLESLLHLCQIIWWMSGESSSPMLTFSRPAHLGPFIRVSSTVLPRTGSGPALPSDAVREGHQGQLSHLPTGVERQVQLSPVLHQ